VKLASWVLLLLLAGLQGAVAASEESQAVERIRQTLLYGIDSQVLEAIQRISSTKDGRFTKELVSVLADTRSPDVKRAVLGVFEDQRLKEGEGTARQLLGDAEHQSSDVLIAAAGYLSAIGASGLSQLLIPLIDSADNGVASAAIRACGKSGDTGCATVLESKLKSQDFPEARKADVILALGELKDQKAVDELIAIAGNTDEDKVRRVYAADALGKIGDARALPVLRAMFAENDALARAYAASALAHFGIEEVFPMLLQGLRDDDAKVREQCAKALGRRLSAGQIEAALPALEYKARYDPVRQVRVAAITSIGAMGSAQSEDILATLYQGSGNSLEIREAALKALVAGSQSRALEAVRAVLGAEGKAVDLKPIEATARVLSETQGSGLKDIYSTLLGSTDAVVRAYAVRGIGANSISELRERVKELSTKDPSPLVQREAEKTLSKL
jgi:HEAT repeat protein